MIQNIVVLGGGSAGLIAALTLKRKLPQLSLTVIRGADIGVIGVGEGTTAAFPRHFFEYLKLSPPDFYAGTEPTWKLGIRFLWGPRRDFYYTFAKEYEHRLPELRRNVGFYHDVETPFVGPVSALMAHDKAFSRKPDGTPQFHNHHAFHIENKKLVAHLESICRQAGVDLIEGNVTGTELARAQIARRDEQVVAALVLENGARVTGDLFIDASGFRSELLGRALQEPVISYDKSLFCDRAVIGGWPRSDEPIRPYTVAETMTAGWCWQIEHEHWINRGYVYASNFISDADALTEFLSTNPKIANEPRVGVGVGTAGEILDVGGTANGTNYLMLSANAGLNPNQRLEHIGGSSPNPGGGTSRDTQFSRILNREFHIAITYDSALSEWKWYQDGAFMETVPDTSGLGSIPLSISAVSLLGLRRRRK